MTANEMTGEALLAARNPAADREFLALLRASFLGHALFMQLAVGYLAALKLTVLLVPGMTTESAVDALFSLLTATIPLNLLALTLYCFGEMAVNERPARPAKRLLERVLAVLRCRRTMANGLPMFLSLFLFIYVFTIFKANITHFQPFSWDQAFDRLDTMLHFGHRPWELLQPLLGFWPVTFALNVVYNFWFIAMNIVLVHFAFMAKPGVQRTRFYLSFMMVWMVGGGVLAMLFSSAGPAFFGEGRMGHFPDPYAGLMAYLREANTHLPIWAVSMQDLLWTWRQEGSVFGGISAMPSMHNAASLLFVLASRGWPAWVRRLLVAQMVLVFLGSIHLGWHYASDAYAAWAVTLAIWWAMGPVARWWEETRPARRFQAALQPA